MRNERYLHLEEEYYANDRKSSRKMRKLAEHKDRSKFKKTDQDQLKKNRELPSVDDSLKYGRVLCISPDGVIVDSEGTQWTCTLKGALKKTHNRLKTLLAVGDIVWFEEKEKGCGTIAQIADRNSILSRADHLSRNKEQLIAVNIDQVIITCSVVAPGLKPSLVDRYIIAAKKGGMVPIIVINKTDLIGSAHSEYLQEKELFEEFVRIYSALNLTVIPVSATTGEGIDALRKTMEGKTSVFSGQSGVGKSRLITSITGQELATGKIVRKTLKGSHTTTSTRLIAWGKESFCIDTPGIKSFGLWALKSDEIRDYFSEISEMSISCKFPDCKHINEPDCAVKKAVEDNEISDLRFASYCALMATFEELHSRR